MFTEIKIDGFRLELTCPQDPERWEVYDGPVRVATMTVRDGVFNVNAPDEYGHEVYGAYPQGEDRFADHERLEFLEKGVEAIKAKLGVTGASWNIDEQYDDDGQLTRTIDGYRLVQTCGACPEQYDVYWEDDKCGYLRLRHGHFRAEYRDEVVFTAYPNGDGIFDTDERTKYLTAAVKAIDAARRKAPDVTWGCAYGSDGGGDGGD